MALLARLGNTQPIVLQRNLIVPILAMAAVAEHPQRLASVPPAQQVPVSANPNTTAAGHNTATNTTESVFLHNQAKASV